jgi:hypothetical protein
MGGQTVLIVPATVPSAIVRRRLRQQPEAPVVHSADPSPVAPAHAVPLVPEQLTPEQVARLRAENAELRRQLERARVS